MIIFNLSESLAKPLVMAKLNMAYLSSLKNRAKLLLDSLPVSPSRVLRATGTSPYHLVPKHHRAKWPRIEQSHLLPEACSPNCTNNRQQIKFLYGPVSQNYRARRSIMMILNSSESLVKPLVMAKLNMAYLSSLKNRAKLLLSSLPVSSSRVLRASGTSPYHLVPKHLRATWPRPEQFHLLPEACSPNGTDNRQQIDFLYGPVSRNFCARRSVMMILNLSESLAKPLVMAKLNMAYLSSLKNRAKLLLFSLPVSPSRVVRAPGTSPYYLVPKHLRASWPRPEQSHLLPEACSPNGTDNRQQIKFLYGPVSRNFCAQRSEMIIFNLSESPAKPLVMAKLNMAYLSSLKNRAKLLLSSLPVSPSRVLRAPGTSPYHSVPKHLRATWPRIEQSHLLLEACSLNGTNNRQQIKFLYGPVSQNFRARRSIMMILNSSESLVKPLVMAKLNIAYFSSLKNRTKLLLSSLPVSPFRVLRATGTSPYHLVPKHLRATWPRFEQFHLLPEACSPNGTDNRQQIKFLYGPVSRNFCARRSVMIIFNLSESFAKPLVMAKLNMAYLSSLKIRTKLLLSSLPVSPFRVLRATGTSPYHLVPKHLRATSSRP